MPKGSRFIWPRKVAVVIGEPLWAKSDGERVPRAAMHELTAQLQEELQRLFDQAQIRAGA
jgi:hypothetical protein